MLKQSNRLTKRSVFSQTCIDVMDFFLSHPDLYFTPLTVALSMERSAATVKDCMNLLRLNFYLSKTSESGSVYHVTSENLSFWHTDFKRHILSEVEK